ncbi:MAG: hypothetical protein A3K19_08810 [Lentisphaerae bacterium RIFOXYB12_FULL_65_16]|nr:MAG: hypothetical protein A3K18_02735 [Lentisphaerae bacterium RIFOXYA12_64_32]OGV86032.1 MAG: hypothetical protein A3K19_08810 [Lentisphaerae bacterium RIFOXYB12_FULL_65_16]
MLSERLVFIRRGGLGDFILSLPLLRVLRARYHRVCLVTRRACLDLLPSDCAYDAVLDADSAEFAGLFAGSAPIPARVGDELRGADVISFLAPDAVLVANFARCGVRNVRWVNSRPTAPPHAALHFFADAGEEPPPGLLSQPLWSGPRCGGGLWVHPGSGGRGKNLPAARFAEFARNWLATHDGQVILSFGEADVALVDPAQAAFRAAGVPFQMVLQPSLAELKRRMCAESGAYVGNDSGVSHLAGALGVPSTVFFRSTDPRIWRPLGRVEVVEWRE